MLDLLLLNVRVHLRFYARNRLLLAFGLLMAGRLPLDDPDGPMGYVR
jgi:hypothetical protein